MTVDKGLCCEDKLIRAKVQLQASHPFFSYVLSRMTLVESNRNELEGHTIGVNKSGQIFYDKNGIDTMNEDFLKTVLCHEAMHVVLQHLGRVSKRDKTIWNVATDLAINMLLVKNDFRFDDGLVPDEVGDFSLGKKTINVLDKTAEQVYDMFEIVNIPKSVVLVGFDKHDNNGQGEEQEGQGEKEKVDWKQVLTDAIVFAESKGNKPEGVRRLVDKLLKPKVSWKHLLSKYLQSYIITDWSWRTLGKRSVAVGVPFPTTKKEDIDVVVMVDTSGSISKPMLTGFLSEIVAIARSQEHIKITCLVGDCEVQEIIPVENGNISKLLQADWKGQGGTDHKPFFEWVGKNKPDARVIVALTDGETDFPKSSAIPTIWALTHDVKVPFGQKIIMDVCEE